MTGPDSWQAHGKGHPHLGPVAADEPVAQRDQEVHQQRLPGGGDQDHRRPQQDKCQGHRKRRHCGVH